VFENRLLRRIFSPEREREREREKMAGGWRRLHDEAFHNLYTSGNIIRVVIGKKMRSVRCIAPMGDVRNAYNILVGKSEGKRPRGRPRFRWKDSIRIDRLGSVDCMYLAEDRDQWRAFVNTVMEL
jgi:hypothetical protein